MFSEMADALGEEATEVFYPVDQVYKPFFRMPPVPMPPIKANGGGWNQWDNNATCRYMLADGSTREASCGSSVQPVPVGRRLPPATTPAPVPVAIPDPAPATVTPAAGTTNYLPWLIGGSIALLVLGGGGKGK